MRFKWKWMLIFFILRSKIMKTTQMKLLLLESGPQLRFKTIIIWQASATRRAVEADLPRNNHEATTKSRPTNNESVHQRRHLPLLTNHLNKWGPWQEKSSNANQSWKLKAICCLFTRIKSLCLNSSTTERWSETKKRWSLFPKLDCLPTRSNLWSRSLRLWRKRRRGAMTVVVSMIKRKDRIDCLKNGVKKCLMDYCETKGTNSWSKTT